MTREELFDRYVEDTLDDEAIAELEKLLAEEPEFAAQFAQDLLATGQFVEVDHELRRIVAGPESGDQEQKTEESPERPKLLIGSEVKGELPPSLQRVLRPDWNPSPEIEAVPLQIAIDRPRPPASTGEIPARISPPGVPPPATQLAPPPPPQARSASPRTSLLPPPAPPPPVPPHPYHGPLGTPGPVFGTYHEQPVLRSSQQRSPVVAISLAVLLLAGIGVALLLGLNKKPPPPPETDGIIARFDAVDGTVLLTRGIGGQQATPGMDLMEGDLVNVQQGSARIAFVAEKSYLHIRSGSEIRFEDQKSGKKVRVVLGEVTAEAAPQPVGKPMVIETANASTIMMTPNTAVTVRAMAKETLVEVSRGQVQVQRPGDLAKVDLGGGSFTKAGEEEPLTAWEFLAGVNFNGDEVEIDGRKWLSFGASRSQALRVEAIGKEAESRQSLHQPTGFVPGAGVREMLMSSVAANASRLSVTWPQPNGRYQVFVWIMEDAGNRVRSLRLNVEEKLVAEDLGKDQNLGEWSRIGPYPATVEDGSLDLLMSADSKRENHDPHLSGIAIYRLAGAGVPAPAAPAAPETVPPVPDAPAPPPAIQPTVP